MPSHYNRPSSDALLNCSLFDPVGMYVPGDEPPSRGLSVDSGNVAASFSIPELTNPGVGFAIGESREAYAGARLGPGFYPATALPLVNTLSYILHPNQSPGGQERDATIFGSPPRQTGSDSRRHRDHAYIRTDDTSIRSQHPYPVGFYTLQEAVAHVRAIHVPDKPFTCTTCGASFMRKQDAVRHVNTMNSGKKYKCCVCKEAYSRKDYCLVHEKRCLATRRGAGSL